jgi:hypothetical protein
MVYNGFIIGTLSIEICLYPLPLGGWKTGIK